MIRSNNPAIDVEALMRRVREEAARLRDGGAIESGRRQRLNATDRVNEILQRQKTLLTFLEMAEVRNQPRTQVPARLGVLRGVGKHPVRFMLRIFNYFSKPQRETAAAQNAALRELNELVTVAVQELMILNQRVALLSEQLETRESTLRKT